MDVHKMGKNILSTTLCDLLGIEYPILLAGMARTAGIRLAAAVSNAGGLGVIGATYLDGGQLRRWIGRMRELTDKPFGVDLLVPQIPSTPSGSGRGGETPYEYPPDHLSFVERLKTELEVPAPTTDEHKFRLSRQFIEEQVQVVLEERPAVLASGLGLQDDILPELHARGIKVISMVGNVRTARRVAEGGADIIVAQGHESGGHTGKIGTLVLVPQVVDAVSPIPVVAAGGIGDGRGLAAALALGAVGVWMGTAFLCCDEAFVDYVEEGIITQTLADNWQEKVLRATEEDTHISYVYTGKTCRNLKDKLVERWEKEGPPTLPMPYQRMLLEDLQWGLAEKGLFEYVQATAGQVSGMLTKKKPAKQLIDEMVTQAIEIFEQIPPSMLQRDRDR